MLSTKSVIGTTLLVAAVAALVYLIVEEFTKKAPLKAELKGEPTSAKAARAATHEGSSHLSPPRKEREGIPVALSDAFQEFDVDRSNTRIVNQEASNVPDSMFLQEFVDGDKSTFRPINKEEALRSANTRPSQQMQSSREGTKARTVGLYPLAFAGRKAIERPLSTACVGFNDTDTRALLASESTACLATESCPWQK